MAGIRTKPAQKQRVVTVRQASPVIIRETVAPRRRRAPTAMVVAPRAQVTRRRSSAGSRNSVGALTPNKLLSVGLGGAIFGYIEKTFTNLPTLPMVGRSGTIAIAAYFMSKQGGMGHAGIVKDVGIAAAAITGYQLGKTGKVSGEDLVGDDVVGEDQI